MSRSKYRMTDAAAKRILKRLLEVWEENHHISIETVEGLLKEEDFSSSWRSGYVADLVQWLIEETSNGAFAHDIAKAYIRSHYELRAGIDNIHGGLQQVGILPYPEDDS